MARSLQGSGGGAKKKKPAPETSGAGGEASLNS